MKIQCDVCEKRQATVICCADEAALCAKCDVEVHAANKLASKHQRLQLHSLSSKLPSCDICQEKAAFIFCVEDRALFCQECDQTIHLASSLAGDHQRYLATGIRVALGSKCTKEAEKKCIDPSNQSAQQISIKPNVNQPPTVPSPGWAVDDLLEFSELESTIKFQTTTGVESQSVEVPSFTTQPEDGDDLHQETQHSARARARDSAPASAPDGDSTKTRRCNWNEDEDMRLVSGYLNTGKDPITNTNQSGETFWSRVSTEWNKYKKHGQPVRDSKSCKNRWQTIDITVSKFCGCYGRSIRQQASGESEDDVLNRALSTYHEDELGPFTNLHAWEVLRHEPKWSQLILDVINRNNPSSASAASSKRSRSDMESDTPNANTPTTPTSAFSGYAIERPEGIKACKRKGKKVASASCDKEDELANEMFRQKEAMLSKAHELAMTKEAHKREKQTHFAKMKSMEMEMEQKKMEMENAQIKRAEIQHNWEMLQFLMGQTNLGHNGETLKQKLMKELSVLALKMVIEYQRLLQETIDAANEVQERALQRKYNANPESSRRRRRRSYIERGKEQGYEQIYKDYFAEEPTYPDHIFRRRFRMRTEVFKRIADTLENGMEFFQQRPDALGRLGISALQKCSSALRMLAYGSAADCCDEYLRISEVTARQCLENFVDGIITFFGDEYLRCPTVEDTQHLLSMEESRGFPEMLGSIDCMHWKWKNCPTAWKC